MKESFTLTAIPVRDAKLIDRFLWRYISPLLSALSVSNDVFVDSLESGWLDKAALLIHSILESDGQHFMSSSARSDCQKQNIVKVILQQISGEESQTSNLYYLEHTACSHLFIPWLHLHIFKYWVQECLVSSFSKYFILKFVNKSCPLTSSFREKCCNISF